MKPTPRQRKRIEWLAGATRWTKIGSETVEHDVLITRIQRKPPFFKLETYDISGKKMTAVLKRVRCTGKGAVNSKEPRWELILGPTWAKGFHTKRRALLFFARITAVRGKTEEVVL
jgi:hypothetical protein